jgi:phage terminase large subunit-like protein
MKPYGGLASAEDRTKLIAFLQSATEESEAAQLQYDWSFYARPNQLLPAGDWLTWLLLADRGFGKTRAAAEAVRALVCGPTPLAGTEYAHIAIVAETAADARDVCVEGESGILSVHPKDFRPGLAQRGHARSDATAPAAR